MTDLANVRSMLTRAVRRDGQTAAPDVTGRCDRCPAPATVSAHLSGRLLTFCGHHGRQHEVALRAQGAVLVGELPLDRRPRVPADA